MNVKSSFPASPTLQSESKAPESNLKFECRNSKQIRIPNFEFRFSYSSLPHCFLSRTGSNQWILRKCAGRTVFGLIDWKSVAHKLFRPCGELWRGQITASFFKTFASRLALLEGAIAARRSMM